MGSFRIALALPHLGVYGGIRRFLELGEVWTRRGHEVAILVPDREAAAGEGRVPVRALVYGRLSRRRKGTWVAVRAIERASAASGVPVTLTLFDSPPEGAGTPLLPRPLRIPHRWVLNPSQRELADLYGKTDLFVSAVEPLLRDPERRRALATRGTARIQEFSWERTADRIERAFEARMGGGISGRNPAQAVR